MRPVLAQESADPPECRVLCNVRFALGEGVDVPAPDAVLFMSPRNSQVDGAECGAWHLQLQTRTEGEKKYGYIIILIVIS